MKVMVSKSGDEFVILDSYRKNNRRYCKVKFLATDNVDEFRKDQVDRLYIKDRLKSSVRGIGSIGNIKKVDHLKEYSIWAGMIDRCYNKESKVYNSYGSKGVFVCERWLTFENFVSDLPIIEGYDHQKFINGELELDKDKKQEKLKEKVYSLEMCSFISKKENGELRELLNRDSDIVGISPFGEHVEIKSVYHFAIENGFTRAHIYNCVNGKRKTHKKWKFYKKEEVNTSDK